MNERIDNMEPIEIKKLFQFPYMYFSKKYGDKNKSLLDIACGNNEQYTELEKKFKNVISADVEILNNNIIMDIRNIKGFYDIIFSFETIEHISKEDGEKVLKNIKNHCNMVIFGSVNSTGPDFINGVEIWKSKNNKNPYHLNEMSNEQFRKFFGEEYKYYHSVYENNEFKMLSGLSDDGYVNYAVGRF